MIEKDIENRVKRLLITFRTDDMDRMYLFLREAFKDIPSIREIGDFIAHRDKRDKGPLAVRIRDLALPFKTLAYGGPISEQKRFQLAEANLRIATDEQLEKNLGLTRDVTNSVLPQAIRKKKQGIQLTDRERRVLRYLGESLIWNVAFDEKLVLDQLEAALNERSLLPRVAPPTLAAFRRNVSLYIISLFHGATVMLDHGEPVTLRATVSKEGYIGVKVLLGLNVLAKPVTTSLWVYWTTIEAKECCCANLLLDGGFDNPIEIGADSRLCVVG
ncbi:hypothetical protein EXN32_12415 [Agrobacterium tumefaciens]|uniref:hypothetical protein n=1 Tax=Agrobacterium TaxID=357 RepID=UPI00115EF6B8|nr:MULTISPECIES: hypothetical protein [Agrobacterium]MDA5243101.1 hypothetical protein [Agrobacterium sp. MAFF310724]MDA5247347.1 hypothetical protein [Agrobacterium sp. MAFF210268]TRB16291.1 hypothetical protein EXN32_12415 [Agrobacterium tumefaciens]